MDIDVFKKDGSISKASIEEVLAPYIKQKDTREKLYHFTSLESFWKIWCSQKLLFFSREKANDIAENTCPIDGNYLPRYFFCYMHCINEYKQLCLSKDALLDGSPIQPFLSPVMWGYYGSQGKGVCIELIKENLVIPNDIIAKDIEYVPYVPCAPELPIGTTFDSLDAARKKVDSNIDDIYFRKYKDWSFEHEYRLISRNSKGISITGAVSNIYLFDMSVKDFKLISVLIQNIEPNSKPNLRVIYSNPTNGKRKMYDTDAYDHFKRLEKSEIKPDDYIVTERQEYQKLVELDKAKK